MSYRDKGKEILSSVLSTPKNISLFESKIFYLTSTEKEYYNLLYQIVGEFLSGNNVKDTFSLLKCEKIGWKHPMYDDIRDRIKEQDDFVIKPFEVAEGVVECKCGSKRVFSYSKQVRSGDEGTTVFASCMACGKKWTEGG